MLRHGGPALLRIGWRNLYAVGQLGGEAAQLVPVLGRVQGAGIGGALCGPARRLLGDVVGEAGAVRQLQESVHAKVLLGRRLDADLAGH